MKLTAKQEAFCEEYLIDLNATQAAIRAGYSERTADSQGPALLRKTHVADRIAQLKKKRSKKTGITAERVLEELAAIGFSDIGDVVEWGPGGVRLKPSEEIGETRRIVESVSEGRDGIRIKLHNKLGALRSIGDHLGMFSNNDSDDDEEGDDTTSLLETMVRSTARSDGPSSAGEPLSE